MANDINKLRSEEIKKLAPAKAIKLYHLNRYGDFLSFDDALKLVKSTDYNKIASRADEKRIDLLKKLFEQTFMPDLDPVDDDMFYNAYGDKVAKYFNDLSTFDMDFDMMTALLLGADSSLADDPLVYNMIREFYLLGLADRTANFDLNDSETHDTYEYSPMAWLCSYMPFELTSARIFSDTMLYIDPLLSRFSAELGTMDYDNDHAFKSDITLLCTHAKRKLAYQEKFSLYTPKDVEKHIAKLIQICPRLSSGNDAFKKAYADCIALDNGFDKPLAESAEYILEILSNAKSYLKR